MARGGPRPGSGPKRKDPALKALAGTARADRDAAVPVISPEDGPMIPPIHLTDLEQLMFGSIAGMLAGQGRSHPHYSEHVALLAQRLSQIQRLKAVLEMEGDTYQAPTKYGFLVRARPEVAMLADAMRQAQSLLGELMLNPSAAMRIASAQQPTEDDPFGNF